MNPLHTTTNTEEIKKLFEQSPLEIKTLIKGGEVGNATKILGKKFNLSIGNYTILSNIITLTLIGIIDPKDVVSSLVTDLQLPEEDATTLAQELETSIFEKARTITLGEDTEKVKKLEYKGERTPDELRKELLDTTKQASALKIPQTSGVPKKPASQVAGSRSQLLEQLQILGKIPNDEEIENRLAKIQEQLKSIKKEEDSNALDSNVALKSFMFGEDGKKAVEAVQKTATYSVAPTHYNLDPYREVPEE